jgi:hypothetical protein
MYTMRRYCVGFFGSTVTSCFFSCVKKSWPEGMRCDMLPACVNHQSEHLRDCVPLEPHAPLLLLATESPWTLWKTEGWSDDVC